MPRSHPWLPENHSQSRSDAAPHADARQTVAGTVPLRRSHRLDGPDRRVQQGHQTGRMDANVEQILAAVDRYESVPRRLRMVQDHRSIADGRPRFQSIGGERLLRPDHTRSAEGVAQDVRRDQRPSGRRAGHPEERL